MRYIYRWNIQNYAKICGSGKIMREYAEISKLCGFSAEQGKLCDTALIALNHCLWTEVEWKWSYTWNIPGTAVFYTWHNISSKQIKQWNVWSATQTPTFCQFSASHYSKTIQRKLTNFFLVFLLLYMIIWTNFELFSLTGTYLFCTSNIGILANFTNFI